MRRTIASSKALAFGAVVILCVLSSHLTAQNPVPQIVGPVKPTAVAPGSGAFTLTVYGANFVPGAVVNWNGHPRFTTFVSARELQAQIPAEDVATPNAAVITASNPAPGGGNSSSSYAQIEVHAPTAGIIPIPPTTFFINPITIVPANLSENRILDLIGFWTQGAALLLGNGKGTFQFQDTGGPAGLGIGAIGFGDFNNDGLEDVVYASGDYNNCPPSCALTVMLNNGDGTYRLGSTLGTFAGAIAVGDFNGDGKLDIAGIDGSLNIYLGNGDGTFQQGQNLAVGGAAVVTGDFNGDGKLDLVAWWLTGNPQHAVLAILLGNGDGTFHSPTVIPGAHPGGCGTPLVFSDFNGDGNLDLAFCNPSQIGIMLGNGDGTFKAPTFVPAGYERRFSFAAGDFNSDGKIDLVSSHSTNDLQFWTLLGNGDGTFQPKQVIKHLPGGLTGELGIQVGDFNCDGLLDFLLQPGLGDAGLYLQHHQ